MIEKIPNSFGIALSWVLIAFMAADITLSGMAVKRNEERKQHIAPSNSIEEFIDEHYDDEYMNRKYPNMISIQGQLQH